MKALQPARRIYDSRTLNQPLKAGEVRTIDIMAAEVEVNIAVVNPTDPGWLTAWSGPMKPDTSNVNFMGGITISNLARVGLIDGKLNLESNAVCHVIVDLQAAG